MILSKRYKDILLLISITFLFQNVSHGQFQYNWNDPVDVGFFDLGDNKLLLYNAIGLGLMHFLSKQKNSIKSSDSFQTLSIHYYQEYRKVNRPEILDIKYKSGKKWKRGIWLGYEGMAYVINDLNTFGGIGISPFFSWNILNTEGIRISFDNGVGPVYFFQTFPEGGTRFNFSTTYGIEIEVKTQRMSYAFGGRNTHFSNAFIAGRDRNPAFDGAGLYFSLRW